MEQSKRLDPATPLPIGGTIGDFWSWAYSDLMTNVTRGIFAEYLVSKAANAAASCRIPWAGHDVELGSLRNEVKSSAYVQSWEQPQHTTPEFDIAAKRPDRVPGSELAEPARVAHVYVFCMYHETEKVSAYLMDVTRWTFFVVPTALLAEKIGSQKSVRLARLKKLFPDREVSYVGLPAALEEMRAALLDEPPMEAPGIQRISHTLQEGDNPK